jgi:Mannosylglycerate hydrolase MGH1-like glycoside hydrolase domain
LDAHGAEGQRLAEDADRSRNWKRWGPYLSERQWGTVREDYSANGACWEYFPHDHARSRAYRWGEDGLLGWCDREGRVCFGLALWNGRDPILKERLFGLTGPEGNHGEDVKECYYFLDALPTHAYAKALYKYPQAEFPYAPLVEENRRRTLTDPEFELVDTGVFDGERYFDVFAEYAKAAPNDTLIRITIANRGPETATIHLLPSIWFRNTWSWGRTGEGFPAPRPRLARHGADTIRADHPTLGTVCLVAEPAAGCAPPTRLFCENETNFSRLHGIANQTPYVKDAFHDYVVHDRTAAVNPDGTGTKAAFHYRLDIPAGGEVAVRLRLTGATAATSVGADFDAVFAARRRDADEFYTSLLPRGATVEERRVARQCYAGLLWSKQFYYYVVEQWLQGDPAQPPPPPQRWTGRNEDWTHLYTRDVISMPDTWEYPWFAAWDLAFHMIPFAKLDPQFAKEQLVLFLREWYMHPNGQLPAYEFAFGDVNPPVHAWACWRVYKMTAPRGKRDRIFLERTFQKLLLNFTWWVNRKDPEGHNLFAGGFLGLDNIGAFDRSKPLPTGGHLEQADGTAWMAFFCATMLSMAFELAREDPVYEDLASKFFEHFIAIADAMNSLGGTGLWNEPDGFYYDQLHVDGRSISLRVRSLVGLLPLIACEILEESVLDRLPSFRKRMDWFIQNRPELTQAICCMQPRGHDGGTHRMLAIPSRERLTRVLRYMLDEREFLSPHGLRSVSRAHRDHPYIFRLDGSEASVAYVPGESNTRLFGGNSNWRGPIWFPLNFLLIEALERYHHFYGDDFRVEYPTGSGQLRSLGAIAQDLAARLATTFLPDAHGVRPCHGDDPRYATDPHWRDLLLFHEYFHGDTGRGLGASHQTGWTALVAKCLDEMARARRGVGAFGAHHSPPPP